MYKVVNKGIKEKINYITCENYADYIILNGIYDYIDELEKQYRNLQIEKSRAERDRDKLKERVVRKEIEIN